MKPVTFSCEASLPLAPEEIAQKILDVDNWTEFAGCWPIPGIRTAEFEIRTPEVVGSRIRVTNTDGSSHVEEIVHWEPDRRVQLHMHSFSAPLSKLATGFDETWKFERAHKATRVTRSFVLHARSTMARFCLAAIAIVLKRAIARHLTQIR